MKASEAMLRGFEMAGENQCFKTSCEGKSTKPAAVCAVGALRLGLNGNALNDTNTNVALAAFYDATHVSVAQANDAGMSIPDIAGILKSEGY